MKKQPIYIILIVLANSFNSLQAQIGIPFERGICYAKCLLHDSEIWEETYPVFMGEKADSNSYVESIDISLENEEPLYIQIVTDTALNKNYWIDYLGNIENFLVSSRWEICHSLQ